MLDLTGATKAATFTDPGFTRALSGTVETFTATINWGDGTPVEAGTVSVTQGSPGVLTAGSVAGSHTYADNGTYTVTVSISDDDSGSGSATFTVTVNNVAPSVSAAANQTANEGSLLDLTGATKAATF